MDDEKLIKLVKQNELIYNKYSRDYKSIGKKKAAWQRIAHEMEANESECIRRWTCLRDRYTKESRRLTALSNNGMTTSHMWPLIEEMEFLKQHIVNRSKSVLGSSSYSIKVKEQSEQFNPESFITDQEGAIEYEFITEPFQFKSASSPLSEEEQEQEEIDAFLPTETQSSTPFVKRHNSIQLQESQASHLPAVNSKNQRKNSRKRKYGPNVEEDLSTALEMFKQICGAARTRSQNPAVYGFGQMIVETICEMSARKQAIAMQKVTELVMDLKMEPETM